MRPGERWLATLWPLVHARLPAPPARVLDLGCGPLGGFVPFLQSGGYDGTGVDPNAPDSADYHRVEFEHLELPQGVDAVIASTSLHHVADPAALVLSALGARRRKLATPAPRRVDEFGPGMGTLPQRLGKRRRAAPRREAAAAAGRTVRASPSRVWPVLLPRSCRHDRRRRAGRNRRRTDPSDSNRLGRRAPLREPPAPVEPVRRGAPNVRRAHPLASARWTLRRAEAS